ncbi:SDR family NAD(P)-dependent oxidoreductase [Actinoplanes sp. NPDC023801]|uniref:SDR family NAD(P)-dependent oxidoreductase n=1 Tax=Actinoplanes sp. NPDC023801 TaxID=3154595 RepID=UPI0033E6CDC0
MTAIAIVGMACRYPDATSPAELWQTVLGRRLGFRLLPAGRLGAGYRGGRDDIDTTYVKRAGLLRDWHFDRERFGIPGKLFRSADLSHWLALETAADALADAGLDDGGLQAYGIDRDQVGVVLGNSLTGEFSRAWTVRARLPFLRQACSTALGRAGAAADLSRTVLAELDSLVRGAFPDANDETLAGSLSNTIAGRICNHFDFHGTGYTVDGACSSSLLAIMTACRALTEGELDVALAGGVDLSLDPLELVGFARLGALAAEDMRVYDAHPTGFLPGEGCGVVVLMRADRARQAGLRVYAEIRGWGTSSDGSGGLTRPAVAGQVLAMRRAYRMAGVTPADIDLVEGHGTGTAVGDQVELAALTEARGSAPAAALGTVKANIGHTKAAAGVAGLIKAAMAVHHGMLPPTTGCEQPHELLRGAPLRVLGAPEQWRRDRRTAVVSSMGFGGINTHVVLTGGQSHPAVVAPRWSAPSPAYDIVLLAGRDRADLDSRLAALTEQAPALSTAEVHDVACTEFHRGRTGTFRAALVAATPGELAVAAARARKLLDEPGPIALDEKAGAAVGSGPPARVGLLFPGQAAPVRRDLPAWATGLGVPPLPDGATVTDGDVATRSAQPAVVRQSLAALAWLDALGCRPSGAVGHSLGEVSALVWSGALTREQGLALAADRGRVMAEHGTAGTTMAGLSVGPDGAAELVRGTAAVVSGQNAPRQTTVSGPTPDVRTVLDRAARAGIHGVELPVSHGFHSPAMAPATEPFRAVLAGTDFRPPTGGVISTVLGRELTASDHLPTLLAEQLTAPVRFRQAAAVLAGRCDLLVEAGPGGILCGLVRAGAADVPAVTLDSGGDPRRHAFATAALAAAAAADPAPYFAGRGHRTLDAGRPITLLHNPCETLPALGEPVPVPAPAAEPAGPAPVAVADTGADPLQVLRSHLAALLELPSVRPDARLLADLHLSSLQVVQVVADTARLLGRTPRIGNADLAAATVAEVAEVVAALPVADAAGPAPEHGVRAEVRAFTHTWAPLTAGPAPAAADWAVAAPDGHWLHELCRSDHDAGSSWLAVAVPDDAGDAAIAALLQRIGADRPDRLLVVHHGHPAAAAITRSAVAELPGCAATVVRLPAGGRLTDLGLCGGTGYREVRVHPDGSAQRAVMRVRNLAGGGQLPLTSGDVLLVTGGLRGITAYSAAAVAERRGCTLVVLGRTAADDPDVLEALAGLRERVPAHYLSCDVTDPDAVAAAVAAAGEWGTVAGVVHGAGRNEPRRLENTDATGLRSTLAPKVDGLRTVLAVAGDELKLVVAYGSIIGRTGLSGQSEYCVANDWMRAELEQWAARHPRCRTHLLEWSVWEEHGMGVRLGTLDSLRQSGVTPIEPAAGCAALLDVLGDPDAPVTVLLTSRFPRLPTFAVDDAPAALGLRFTESRRDLLPAVETTVESALSLGADPYLDDHRIDGAPVFPAVLGLEAMAQAVTVLEGPRQRWSLRDLAFDAPITVPERGARTIRAAALAGGDGVEVCLRDDTDGFATVRFRGVAGTPEPEPPVVAVPELAAADPSEGAHPFYGSVLFHRGRFRRLLDYRRLSAFEVSAVVDARPEHRWFSDFHGDTLLLGDPGAHDATIHALLACVPHRRALPVRVERFTVWRPAEGLVLVEAVEREHTADEYVYDVLVRDLAGRPLSRWTGLGLRAIGPSGVAAYPAALVGPLLTRKLIECGMADDVDLTSGPPGREPVGGRAGVREVTVRHHGCATLSLTALAPAPVGLACSDDDGLPASPDADADRVAAEIADKTGEPVEHAWQRVRTAADALPGDLPLRVEQVGGHGVVVLRRNGAQVLTARVPVAETGRPLTVAVAVGHGVH